ncbi:MAG: glycogen/starch/alpha-glucan phosphorylase [Clostridium sp.]|jgi:starch phosphorylase|nr:glycogen/starch/alpha-glucan phosphorylase [Clostridium sp.]
MTDKKIDRKSLIETAYQHFGKEFDELTNKEKYHVVSKAIMQYIIPQWLETEAFFEDKKKAYYLSAEFLMGRALGNNLINLKIEEDVRDILSEMETSLGKVEDAEHDAGLGNGGLGRLAACFLDSAATEGYPLIGYGIRYEYGIFHQQFINGEQVEEADNWGALTDPWALRRESERCMVTFSDQTVYAVPYDTPIIGYGGKTINKLRLFVAEPLKDFDFQDFNNGRYRESVSDLNDARTITRILYPNDNTHEGKILRLKQQYFFTSASLQDMVRKHKAKKIGFDNFHKYHAIQLNDTHPSVAVPELIRLLMKEGLEFSKAFDITQQTLAYTNHTILQEALEKWNIHLFQQFLPEIYSIIERIQEKLTLEMTQKQLSVQEIENLAIIDHRSNVIHMAYLAIYGTHSTNGVAQLHSNILKTTELRHWYKIYPERFNNKTNGITQRRWFLLSNPEMSAFVTELLGSDAWITELTELKGLMAFADDEEVIKRFMEIKKIKKQQLADYVKFHESTTLDINSIFDIQIKRMHEYKRQLMNAFHILDLYYRIKEKGETMGCKRTFIFGAKAAPGYFRAKGIIKYIHEIKHLIDNDEDVKEHLEVVFVENYDVSYAELLFPAADISEQISTTGKEASGTGNMKFMLNGACTVGTLDGANVEIVEEAGIENNFIFGPKIEEMAGLRKNYKPKEYYEKVPGLKRVVDSLVDGTFSDDGTGAFRDLHISLLDGHSWETADDYFVLRDFDEYRQAQNRICDVWQDPLKFARMCFVNMANAGKFSSDRTIVQYAEDIWNVEKM